MLFFHRVLNKKLKVWLFITELIQMGNGNRIITIENHKDFKM